MPLQNLDFSGVQTLGDAIGGGIEKVGDSLGFTKRGQMLQTLKSLTEQGASYDDIARSMAGSGNLQEAQTLGSLGNAQWNRGYQDRSLGQNDAHFNAQMGLERDKFGFQKAQAAASAAQGEKPQWGVIGQDEYGRPQYGFISARAGTVTPYQPQGQAQPQASNAGPAMPPPPAGVDPVKWRDAWTKDQAAKAFGGQKEVPLPAEIGARLGIGANFINNDLPAIRSYALGDPNAVGPDGKPAPKEGAFGGYGLQARAELQAGMGEGAQMYRRVQTGIDALVRNLTGAGKNLQEATDYARRYDIGATDSAKTIEQKLIGLEADIKAAARGALAGRNTTDPDLLRAYGGPQQNQPQPQQGQPRGLTAPPPDGTVVQGPDGRRYRVVNQQPVPME